MKLLAININLNRLFCARKSILLWYVNLGYPNRIILIENHNLLTKSEMLDFFLSNLFFWLFFAVRGVPVRETDELFKFSQSKTFFVFFFAHSSKNFHFLRGEVWKCSKLMAFFFVINVMFPQSFPLDGEGTPLPQIFDVLTSFLLLHRSKLGNRNRFQYR